MIEAGFYVAVAVVAGLAAVAIYYQWRLYKLRQKMREQSLLAKEVESKHRAEIDSSMRIICRAVVAGQVDSVEASIRLSALMDQLGLSEEERQDYTVFDKMAHSVSHIPILDAWKGLPKDKKRSFENEMQQYETQLKDFVVDAAGKMLDQRFNKRS